MRTYQAKDGFSALGCIEIHECLPSRHVALLNGTSAIILNHGENSLMNNTTYHDDEFGSAWKISM